MDLLELFCTRMPECSEPSGNCLSMTNVSQPKRLISLVSTEGLSRVGISRDGVEALALAEIGNSQKNQVIDHSCS